MTWKYYHDAANKTVIAMQGDPEVREHKNKRGRRIGWFVTSEARITRADNVLHPAKGWKYRVRSNPSQLFDAHYSREDAVGYFFSNHEPNLPTVDADEYERLREQYHAEATENTE